MTARIEDRECGCRIKHERVYVCERHAQLPEKIRNRLSEIGSKVMADEIQAAVKLERERCAKIAEEFAPYRACYKIASKIRED